MDTFLAFHFEVTVSESSRDLELVRASDVEGPFCSPDEAISQHMKSRKHPLFTAFRASKSSLGLTGVLVDGLVVDDTEQVHNAICAHWAEGFSEKPSCTESADTILNFQTIFPTLPTNLRLSNFLQ